MNVYITFASYATCMHYSVKYIIFCGVDRGCRSPYSVYLRDTPLFRGHTRAATMLPFTIIFTKQTENRLKKKF